MKLFTKEIDQKLFDQYMMGNNLEDQMVVAKIFNPYGNGVWYLLNSDPSDPDYIWAIVDLFDVEMGSVSREELETLKVPPFRLGLERDLYFTPVNAKKLYESLLKGEKFEDGGTIDIKKDQNGENWVFPNNPQGDTYGIKLAAGGMTAGRWYKDNSGQEFRYIGESQGKLLFNDGEKIVYKDESDFEEAPKQKKMFGFFEDGGEVYSKPLNRATNLKVRDYLEKEGLSKQETGGDYEKFLGQALVTSLRDSNFSKEANEIIYILDKSVKGDEVYDTKYYNPIPSIVRIGEKVAKICKYDAVEITDAYFFVSKMYGTGSVANAIAKVFGRYELSGKFKFEEGGYMAMGGESKGKRYKVNVYYGGEMQDEEFYTDSLEEAERISQGGEHSEIYDNEKKEFVEVEYAKGGMFEFKPYGKTKGIYKIYYKADGKPQTEIWETKEMAVSAAKRYSSPKMAEEYSNVKVFDEDGSEVDYMSEVKYDEGGETDEGVDLFEDYDDIPENVRKVLDKHSDGFEDKDYKNLEKAKKELETIGYTFEYGLDGEAYDLRKIGQKGKNEDEYAKGGELNNKKINENLKELETLIKKSEVIREKLNAEKNDEKYSKILREERDPIRDKGFDILLNGLNLKLGQIYKYNKIDESNIVFIQITHFTIHFIQFDAYKRNITKNNKVDINDYVRMYDLTTDISEELGANDFVKIYKNLLLLENDEIKWNRDKDEYVLKSDEENEIKNKEIEKNKKKELAKDWFKFIKDNQSYFEIYEETEDMIHLNTREHGNVGNEVHGQKDIEEAKNILKIVKEKYPNTKGKIYTIDEWVDLELTFVPNDKMAMGGKVKFEDKVKAIKASLLKRKKVSPKVQKDYGKTYSPKEAEESAKRIAGSMVKKEKRKPRVSKILEKMKKGTQINKKKSTFKDRMKELSTKIKERKTKTTK